VEDVTVCGIILFYLLLVVGEIFSFSASSLFVVAECHCRCQSKFMWLVVVKSQV